jgi:hypothetical protein
MGQLLRVEAEIRIERIQLVAANVACGSIAAEMGGSPPLTLSANILYPGQVVTLAAAKLPH